MRPQNASMKYRAKEMAKKRWAMHPDVKPPRRVADEARVQAQLEGKNKYQGNDCKRKHGGLRYTSNGHCVLCLSERER